MEAPCLLLFDVCWLFMKERKHENGCTSVLTVDRWKNLILDQVLLGMFVSRCSCQCFALYQFRSSGGAAEPNLHGCEANCMLIA